MQKIKLIGPKFLCAPLALLGMEIHPAESEAETRHKLASIAKTGEAALVFIFERQAANLKDEIEQLNQRPELTVALLPDNRGQTGLAAERINKLVRHAIGVEITGRE
ncbi:hypothetical protein A2276_04560 [candidate division WOR-1 bacterium RIFOXYA12_FULL_43_27]|uniref:V-type ATP synthase subunit F n=1 Tax=candidate division WOR-1 bacterium RIFOXYC2_FULL_46_14 TaxID=1802587 RepID=A0A1F4U3W6_UNCSA|nr:MAG: hypothetical protein A2276_04560 [candidate division WOR-1 bacterium RIFOXYA12_FULL_43_27]OGC18902.1 MAG: hypothetical protein A2292_08275 [candidate division WOR-1 bacterium RIFOXYB2_FULL_46_45]OGC29043.1 MAG: hypothetical protein A2232_03340 [candidate division WOR-1 bacterium RIFOXYA2_FULL_46_56]OGC39664.1 MAG: hypothetical protein A2438_06730 [candidate division WOR-1 bacterium RIFOXYC2_FULL_46_14]